MKLIVRHADGDLAVQVERRGEEYRLQIEGQSYVVLSDEVTTGVRSLLVDGEQYEVAVRSVGKNRYEVTSSAGVDTVLVQDPLTHLAEETHDSLGGRGSQVVDAYMPGRVVSVLVEEGGEVVAGQGVVVLEAMKMENEIQAERAGVVSRIYVESGQAVELGDPLFELA